MRRALLLALSLSACHRTVAVPAPPRVDTPPDLPAETSTLVVPLAAPLEALQAALDREVPRRLWSIDQHLDACVPAQRVNLGIGKLKVTPKLGCQVVGQVVRGPLTLSGRGDRLLVAMPIHATISANDVGGIASKTATGAAVVHASARLSITGNWEPTARVAIDYDWTQAPGIDFLGRRIEFAAKADQRLQPVVVKLQETLPRKLAMLKLRDRLAGVWRHGFTVVSLSRADPPAWMRVTPKRLGFGGYRVVGRTLQLTLAAEALTETFVGPRPAQPEATPLPPPSPIPPQRGLRFFVPVLADYHQLEPVVLRALRGRAAKGITLRGVGPVDARVGEVTVYATGNGRLAVGVKAKVTAREHPSLNTSGQVWLTALPFNRPDSQVIQARDVRLAVDTDSRIANLLIRYFGDDEVQASIAGGLRHDFAPEYARLLSKARAAIAARREGDFLLSAQVTKVETGRLAVTGAGLFLPVRASGAATVAFRPR